MSDYVVFKQNPYVFHARCADCDWADTDYITATAGADRHVIETGHTVDVESGYLLYRTTQEESLIAMMNHKYPEKK